MASGSAPGPEGPEDDQLEPPETTLAQGASMGGSTIGPGSRVRGLVERRIPVLKSCQRHFRGCGRSIAAVGALSMVIAQAEAAVLVMIAPVALSISEGKGTYSGKLGPVALDAPVTTLIVLCLGAVAVAAAMTLVSSLVRARMISRWEREQRVQIADEYFQANLPAQLSTRSSEFLTAFGSYVGRGGLVLGAITQGLKALFALAIFLTASVVIDVRGTALIVASGLAFTCLLLPINRRLKRSSKKLARLGMAYGEEISEVTAAAREARVFGAWREYARRLDDLSDAAEHLQRRQILLSSVSTPIYQYVGLVLALCILLLAARVPTLNVAVLGAVALLLLRSLSYGQQVQNAYQSIIDGVPYVDLVATSRRILTDGHEVDGDVELGPVKTVVLEGVGYTYDGVASALSGVDASLRCGEVVGVVGPSGSGKSTLAQILLRMRAPTDGSILVNGEAASGYTKQSFYRHFTFVPQSCQLLHASVADNITLFDGSVTRDQVIDVAKRVGLHDTIMALDDGYETALGPTTRDLSGGQIQRIGIARAVIRGAEVIVLDEPTSALDVHSEATVQEALADLGRDVLVVIIAHRLSTLTICDRVLVMDGGHLIAEGSFEQLLLDNEYFRSAITAGQLELKS